MRLRTSLAALFLSLAAPAQADVLVQVDNSSQRMQVYVDGALAHQWKVSTGLPSYETPPGDFCVYRMERMWHSRKYEMAPMPYSLFFNGGVAIHGTGATRQLGRRASHGCVRLHPANARALYSLVGRYGGARVLVRG